jgi:hypothetical protein
MRLLPSLLLALFATPAFAQFPPPGDYACVDAAGKALGTMLLLPAGDYLWTGVDGVTLQGQMTSSGVSVRAISGVLLDAFHLTGSYATNILQVTTFVFDSDVGRIECGPRG